MLEEVFKCCKPQSVETGQVAATQRVKVLELLLTKVDGGQTPVHAQVDGNKDDIVRKYIHLGEGTREMVIHSEKPC